MWSLIDGDPAPGDLNDVFMCAEFWWRASHEMIVATEQVSTIEVRHRGAVVEAVRSMTGSFVEIMLSLAERCAANARVYRQWHAELQDHQREAGRLLDEAEAAAAQRLGAEALISLPKPPALADPGVAASLRGQQLLGGWEAGRARGIALTAMVDEELIRVRARAQMLRAQVEQDKATLRGRLLRIELPSLLLDMPQCGRQSPESGLAGFLAPALATDPALARGRALLSKAAAGDQQAQQEYLSLMGALSAAQLSLLVVAVPEVRSGALSLVDAAWAKTWWAGLSASRQEALIAAVPGLIGNLNGVPYILRDQANRKLVAWLRGQPGQSQRICDALEGIEKSLTGRNGKLLEDRFLVSFDLNGGKPLAAVSIGNLDTAGNVTFAVPGMGTTVASGGITTWTEAAQNLAIRQGVMLRKLGQELSLAVVSWVGYEAPGMLPGSMEVFGKERAVDGGARLAAALDGFQITRQGSGGAAPAVHVVAHSYGTTASVYALTKTQWQVASVTFVGSAGIDANVARSASELNVARSASGAPEVYATSSMMDWVAPAGVAGSQINGFIGGIGDLLTDPAGAGARFMDTLINQRPVEARVYPT